MRSKDVNKGAVLIDGRPSRHLGYELSKRKRQRVEFLLAAGITVVFFGVFWTAGRIGAAFLVASPFALAFTVLLVCRKPRLVVVALIGYALLAPFDTLMKTASGATVTKYLGLLIVLLALIEIVQRRHVVKPDRALAAWGAYLCWSTKVRSSRQGATRQAQISARHGGSGREDGRAPS